MELTALECKNCGAQLKNENINYQLLTAHCDFCGAVFGMSPGMAGAQTGGAGAFRARAMLDMPKGITLTDDDGAWRLEKRWFSPKYIFMAVFAAMWNTFMIGWHAAAVSSGEITMSLFGLIHTAVGLYLIFAVIRGFINKTIVETREGVLSVNHTPLPARGKLQVETSSLSQLYCKEKTIRTKNGSRTVYEVRAKKTDGTDSLLLSDLDSTDQALYIEQEIETHLGIIDRAVEGEF